LADVLEDAIKFAVDAHSGQTRKLGNIPYILHPLEVASIIGTMTDSRETMAAGILHDTIEDCDVDPAEIRERFGARVSALVQSETEDRISPAPAEQTWMARKEESLLMLSHTKDRDVKILWLADKLSNIRSFARRWREVGDDVWKPLHQKDPAMQKWYYKSIEEYLKDLDDTDAYREYCALVHEIFD